MIIVVIIVATMTSKRLDKSMEQKEVMRSTYEDGIGIESTR